MNKQEAIEKINNMGTLKIRDTVLHQQFDTVDKNKVLDIISKIHEPKKVVVPQFVAEWYEDNKDSFEMNIFELCVEFRNCRLDNPKLRFWFQNTLNKGIQTLVNMHQFGYEVEKEKLYTVEIPNPNSKGTNKIYLCKDDTTGKVYLCKGNFNPSKNRNLRLTESEIKEDFEWAWQFAKEVEE
ncbi:hypothetical protein Si082_01449 [Streptococcus infantarius subsp. infantarius]|nr:hypothetical protein [Streptococcus infantarius subsp. infantarius]